MKPDYGKWWMKIMKSNKNHYYLPTIFFRSTTALFLFVSILSYISCQQSSSNDNTDTLAAIYFNPALSPNDGGYYEFYGEVDEELNSSCGTATGSSSSGGDDSTSTSSGVSRVDNTTYEISSYFNFEIGKGPVTFNKYPLGKATLLMKYQYKAIKDEFNLTPTTVNTSTCHTQDYINCNGTSENPVCETVDGITCGGNHAFIYISTREVDDFEYPPEFSFQAVEGSINWDDGFALNSDNTSVIKAYLTFNMLNSDGEVFKGEIRCRNSEY